MGSRSAHIQVFDRCVVVGVTGNRTEAEHLIGCHLALHDVAAEQTESSLYLRWRQHFDMFDRLRETGTVFVEHAHDVASVLVRTTVVPRTVTELERAALCEAKSDVFV